MGLYDEIQEQPGVLEHLLGSRAHLTEIASALRSRTINYTFIAARGSSDNAARYAQYLLGGVNHMPVALATPSLFSIYGTPPDLSNCLVLGISQSGESDDIVSVVEQGRLDGAATLAITNTPDSPLGRAAEFIIDVRAGEERAVAATKSYTAQLAAIAMLSAALAQDEGRFARLAQVPGDVARVLDLSDEIRRLAERYRYMERCVVLGRGFNYATAYEWSLKLKELAYVMAEPYSSADFQHGPIAIVEEGFPVLAVLPRGAVFHQMLELVRRLADERRAELVVISNAGEALDLAYSPIPLPGELPEWVSPIVGIVPAQLFAYHLTCVKRYDPEHPRGLTKVTITK
jgi:glucosamine--fructose-6-phosphate aminotransferase (isomerizing)